ncbi:MAG: calcium-binding protein [Bacteroidota bacterium]
MKWAFPTLDNPTIIDLSKSGGQTNWSFGANEDVIFIGSDTPRTTKLQTDGGRNIVVLGGEYQPVGDSKSATLHFLNLNGSVHVEGVHIDSKNASQDGIAVGGAPGKQPTVTVQNALIENMHGSKDGVHADIFQTHGSVGDMRFYNVSGDTDYQGFFIAPQYDPPHKSADFENVNVSYNGGSGYTYQYWFLDGANQKPYPITLKNVFTTERSGQHAEDASVWPKAGMGDLGAVRVGNQITWPKMPYHGAITVGQPAKDFGDASKVGANFKLDSSGIHIDGSGTTTTGPTAPPSNTGTDSGTGTGTGSTPVPTDTAHPVSGAPTHWINSTDASAHVAGTAGNDQIAGVEGKADVGGLAGGKGDDTYIVDNAGDKVIELAGQGTDTVVSYAPSYTLSANVENLTIGGTKAAVGIGNDGANTLVANDAGNHLYGMQGDDLLIGGKGNDHLNGGIGADTMKGGAGNDTYEVSRAGDKVVELSGEGVDTVMSSVTYKLGQFVENLTLTGTANINGTGTAYHNVLVGNNGNNVLDGGAGNDRLFGAKGNDKLIGGDGADTFVLKSAGAGTDTIADFKLGTDNLDMHNVLKSVGATSTAQAIKDHLLEVVQHGANAEVVAHAPGHDATKVAVIENVDAAALLKTSDHWS